MFRQRVLTALVLGVLVIAGVLLLPTFWFSLVLLAALCVAAWEWSRLAGMTPMAARVGFVVGLALLTLVISRFMTNQFLVFAILFAALVFWVFAAQRLLRFASNPDLRDGQILGILSGLLVLTPTWVALVALHRSGEAGPGYVLLLLAIVWGADSGAYFSGKRWGRRKLAPTISPGKTVEGVGGGLALATVVLIVGWFALGSKGSSIAPFLAIGVATIAFSVLGDLYESMLKRQRSMKDSGTLLPGHGGMLDRIDSLTAASPAFTFGILGVGA